MMRPAKSGRYKKIFAWAIVAASFCAALSVGTTRGRMIDWASAETVFAPEPQQGYSSDCLTLTGQQIHLADWTAAETQRVLTILVERPEPTAPEPVQTQTSATEPAQMTQATEETTEPTEETTEPTEETTEPAAQEEQTDPTVQTWPQDEITLTPDEMAQQHLLCTAQVQENQILLTLERLPEAPGLAQTVQITVDLQWQGLSGTLCLQMLPYGELAQLTEETESATQPTQQADATLDPVWVRDTMSAEHPVTCVKLNLQTCSDFDIFLTLNGTPLKKVRWSMDGENFALLYDSAQISIPYPYSENWDGRIYLDFSVAVEADQRPTVAVEATGYNRQEFTPVLQSVPQPPEVIVLKAARLPHTIEMATRWGAAVPEVQSVERLAADDAGTMGYLPDETLKASVNSTGIVLESALDSRIPEPGSYRMHLQWIWNGICVEEQTIYFFINTN